MSHFFKITLLTLICVFFTPKASLFAADEKEYCGEEITVRQVKEQDWKSVTSGVNFTEKQEVEKKEKPADMPNIDLSPPPSVNFQGISQILLFILVAVILVFLIYRIATGGFALNNQAVGNLAEETANLEERLRESDVDKYLREALARGEYRLAVRFYFLRVLKAMIENNHTEWKKEKTNRLYLSDVRERPYHKQLRDAIHIYERVWFGQTEFSKEDFERVQPDFQNLLKLI
jgi:hypothetical protein